MSKVIKKYFGNEKRNVVLLYSVLFVFFILLHSFFKLGVGDDVYFSNTEISNIFGFLSFRYQEWSSRILIEFVLVIMCHLPQFCWYIMDSLMILLVVYAINKLFARKDTYFVIVTFLLFFLYPFSQMKETGWYATTINYLWPMACALFSLIPLKNAFHGVKDKKIMYLLYSLTTVFACSQELICALLFGIYFIYIIFLYKKQKINKFVMFQFFLIIVSIFVFILCPGNTVRKIDEIEHRYTAYAGFTVFQKVILGLFSTFAFIFEEYHLALIVLLFLLHIMGSKSTNKFLKINSALPLIIYFGYKLVPNSLYLKQYFTSFMGQLDIFYVFTKSNMLIILFILVFVLSIAINLYFILKNSKSIYVKLTPVIILFVGILSRVMMGFSPTIYASGKRTFVFYHFSLIICIMLILNEIVKNNKENKVLVLVIFVLLMLLQTYQLFKMI